MPGDKFPVCLGDACDPGDKFPVCLGDACDPGDKIPVCLGDACDDVPEDETPECDPQIEICGDVPEDETPDPEDEPEPVVEQTPPAEPPVETLRPSASEPTPEKLTNSGPNDLLLLLALAMVSAYGYRKVKMRRG